MNLTRRSMLSGLGASVGIAFAAPSWATSRLGDMHIDTLSDGHLTLPGDFIFGPMPEAELAPIIARHGLSRDTLTPECNLTLLRDGERTVLFDVGSGPDFQPTAGQLADALDAIGLSPEEVTHVVFTHGHPDHLWGLFDDFGDPMFAEAEYLMGRVERDYWLDPATVGTIGTARQAFAVGAERRIREIADAMGVFDDGAEILPGVMAHATFGHTPGHMSFELRSGGEALMVLGDAVGNHHVAFEQPGWVSGSDQDGPTAAAARLRLLDKVSAEKMQLIGFHLPDGGMGRAERRGDGYVFVPEEG